MGVFEALMRTLPFPKKCVLFSSCCMYFDLSLGILILSGLAWVYTIELFFALTFLSFLWLPFGDGT